MIRLTAPFSIQFLVLLLMFESVLILREVVHLSGLDLKFWVPLVTFEELDPTFSDTSVYKFLAGLAAAIDEEDIDEFINVVVGFDAFDLAAYLESHAYLEVKNELKAEEEEMILQERKEKSPFLIDHQAIVAYKLRGFPHV